MKFAAIDIGSNAVRLIIKNIISIGDKIYSIKISYTRVPIRLGEDVFINGKISDKKIKQLVRTLKAFKLLMDVHDISVYRACATSAMREASNRKSIIKLIKEKSFIDIDIIDGAEEAELIFSNFETQTLDPKQPYLYIDVGGGSTELSLIKKGKKLYSHSLKLGTVRILKKIDDPKHWEQAKRISKKLYKTYGKMIGIGTGGNINRIFKESKRKSFENISTEEVMEVKNYVASFPLKKRSIVLNLKPDRADVIIPAADIYLYILKHAEIDEMVVPLLGLSDGIILNLYHKHRKKVK